MLASCGSLDNQESNEISVTASATTAETAVSTAAETEADTTEKMTDVQTETSTTVVETVSEYGTVPEGSSFTVHYIDVGQADSELIICDGEAMLIDGGNAEDSSLMYTYLRDLGIDHVKYMVATHEDEDHVGGLAGALQVVTVGKAWCSVLQNDTRAFNSFLKYLDQQNVQLEIPETGTEFTLGSAYGKVIGPVGNSSEGNGNSLVIRITYGSTSFLFMGDADTEEESSIIASGAELDSTVLKVGHHGSSSSTSESFLNRVSPEYAVISCGMGNSYGHPTDQTLSRLKQNGVQLYRTDLYGDITCTSDGNSVTFTTEKSQDTDPYITYAELNPETEETVAQTAASGSGNGNTYTFVLNTNTKKIHISTCSSVKQMKDKNKQYVEGTRDEVLSTYEAQGYTVCQNCNAMP